MDDQACRMAEKDLRDDKVRGLVLRVFPQTKTFYVRYTTVAGRRRQFKLGAYPTLKVAEARRLANNVLVRVMNGEDPADDRRADRAASTVQQLADLYLEKHAAQKKTSREDARMLKAYVLPKLGREKVGDVKVLDIEKLHAGMKGHPVQANRVLSLLSKMFALAEKWEMRPQNSNPCFKVERYPERKRKRYASREECALIFDRLRHYEKQYREQAAFLWLLIYTGARPSEIAKARREDLHGDRIILASHKTAESTGEDRVIFLPPQAQTLLAGLPRAKDGRLIGIGSPRHLWRKILADTGLANLRMYDLRHSFASIGISHGLSLDDVRELLGHKSTATTLRYAHLIDENAKAAAAKTANAFDSFAKPTLRVVK